MPKIIMPIAPGEERESFWSRTLDGAAIVILCDCREVRI
jgi:hypothetical protein